MVATKLKLINKFTSNDFRILAAKLQNQNPNLANP
jgi:hypothetical protein